MGWDFGIYLEIGKRDKWLKLGAILNKPNLGSLSLKVCHGGQYNDS